MDFDKFYSWKRASIIAELENAPGVIPDTCHAVYAALAEHGLLKRAEVTIVRLHPLGSRKGSRKGANTGQGYVLTPKGRAAVARSKRAASRLLNELLKENDKLVRKITNQLFKKSVLFVEEEDMYQAACIGFAKTLSKFDPSRFSQKKLGGSFCVYLRHWIRDSVRFVIRDQQTIRHPKTYGMPFTLFKFDEEFLGRNGRHAAAEEFPPYKGVPVTEEMLAEWRTANQQVVSLDGGRDGSVEQGDGSVSYWDSHRRDNGQVPDSSQSPERLMERAQMVALLEKAKTELLTPLQIRVLDEAADGIRSYRNLAKEFGVTEDDVRRARATAMETMKEVLAR